MPSINMMGGTIEGIHVTNAALPMPSHVVCIVTQFIPKPGKSHLDKVWMILREEVL